MVGFYLSQSLLNLGNQFPNWSPIFFLCLLVDTDVAVSAGLLEGVRRSENGLLVPVPAHEHHADRQTLRTAAGHRYGRVMGQVERVRIGEVVQRLVDYL